MFSEWVSECARSQERERETQQAEDCDARTWVFGWGGMCPCTLHCSSLLLYCSVLPTPLLPSFPIQPLAEFPPFLLSLSAKTRALQWTEPFDSCECWFTPCDLGSEGGQHRISSLSTSIIQRSHLPPSPLLLLLLLLTAAAAVRCRWFWCYIRLHSSSITAYLRYHSLRRSSAVSTQSTQVREKRLLSSMSFGFCWKCNVHLLFESCQSLAGLILYVETEPVQKWENVCWWRKKMMAICKSKLKFWSLNIFFYCCYMGLVPTLTHCVKLDIVLLCLVCFKVIPPPRPWLLWGYIYSQ